MTKPKDWKAELGRFEIHVKKQGLEQFLGEIAKWWEAMYPAKADFFKTALRRQREVTKPGAAFSDNQGRDYHVVIRVPTELFLFIKRWIPEFGRDSKDIETLTRVFCDLVRPSKDHRRRVSMYKEPHVELARAENGTGKGEATGVDAAGREGAGERDDHREGLCVEPGEDAPVAPRLILPGE